MSRRTAVAALAAAALGLGLLTAPIGTSRAADPVGAPGRLGFTDAQDQVERVTLRPVEGPAGEEVRPFARQPIQQLGRHDGQASATVTWSPSVNLGYAFVSTRPTSGRPGADDPDGEVWLVRPGSTDAQAVQLTDDDARESHPVAWLDGECSIYGGGALDVVYASDRSGAWDLWVVHVRPGEDDGLTDCSTYRVSDPERVTSGPGDDLWPSWVANQRAESRSLVFSSTRSDPLGDLYELDYPQRAPLPRPASALVQLTSGRAADSDPAPRNYVSSQQACPGDPSGIPPRWLAFTRADDADPRGGLAVLDLDDPGGGVLSLGVSQASQPTWTQDGALLAYRSTAQDPDGAIRTGVFQRACPPDLAVTELTAEPATQSVGSTVAVSVTVVNNSPQRTAGRVTIDFGGLVVPPPECDGRQRCALDIPILGQGGAHTYSWPAGSDDVGLAPIAPGTGSITASVEVTETEGDPIPRADAVPDNDRRSVPLTITPRSVDVRVDPGTEGPELGIQPNPLTFAVGVATLETVVTVYVVNPDTRAGVDVIVTANSSSSSVTSDGSQRVSRPVTIEPGARLGVPFTFTAARPDAAQVLVPITGTVAVRAPTVDPEPGNNSVTSSLVLRIAEPPVELGVRSVASLGAPLSILGRRLPAALSGTARAARVAWDRGAPDPQAAGAVPGSGRAAAARPAAVVTAAVAAAVKPPIEDEVSLSGGRLLADGFGVAESLPSFSVLLIDNGAPFFTETTTLLVTVRPAGSVVSDVLATDGSGRRVVAGGDSEDAAAPSYSPDGRFVAYQRAVCDAGLSTMAVDCDVPGVEIVVSKVDGSDPATIYPSGAERPSGASDAHPAWSPDGTAIAFTRTTRDPATPPAIWVASGLDLEQDPVPAAGLVATSVRALTHPRYATSLGDIDEFDDEAAWSPDGSRIAYTRARFDTESLRRPTDTGGTLPGDRRPSAAAHDSDIWVVEVATGDTAPMLTIEVGSDGDGSCEETRTRVCLGGDDRGADWSPDGRRIVYEHTGWLYLADPQARTDLGPVTGPRTLVSGSGRPLYPDDPPPGGPSPGQDGRFFPGLDWAQDPSWSPDGRQIAFSGHPRGQPDLWGIHALTVPAQPADRALRTVTDEPQAELQPDWQPVADLAIVLTVAPPTTPAGTPATLTARVTNEGIGTALRATARVSLPAGLIAGSPPGGCSSGSPLVCTLGNLQPGAVVDLAIPVTGSSSGTFSLAATTSSRTVDPDPADNDAAARLIVGPGSVGLSDVSVTAAVDPNPGYVGGPQTVTVTVRNAGPSPTEVTLILTVPEGSGPPSGNPCFTPDGCALGTLLVGGQVVRALTLTPTRSLRGDVTARATSTIVDPQAANNAATVRVRVLQPVLTLSPPLGAPGFVTAAIGEDFPPRGRVRLTWDPGLNASTLPIRVRADGTFRTPVVVLVHDQLGIRAITASRVSGLQFAPVEADFLVVPRTQQPPDFQGRG